MNAIAPKPPFPIRALNHLGRGFASLGFKGKPLDAGQLIDEACRKFKLSDFGPGPFTEGMDALIESLENEAALTPLVRQMARADIIKALGVQLQVQDWFNRYPEIADEKIEAPLIIVGMPRTGTTILHELMQLDPDNRLPLTWEADAPCPPPETASYQSDPRIRAAAKELRFSHYLIPEVTKMHRMGEQLPQECIILTRHAFHSMVNSTIYRIPGYQHWLSHEADMAPIYRYHRRLLQLLQWRCPGKRWVLKSPGHLWHLNALLDEYPDAKLIQTHRDPLKIASSMASMLPTLRSMGSDDIRPLEIAREWADNNMEALDNSVVVRQSGRIAPEQIVDIQFSEFMADQAGAVKRIYDAFELPFSETFAESIRRYIASNPHDKDGGHKHRFEDSGLDYQTERKRCQSYQDYFGVASEF